MLLSLELSLRLLSPLSVDLSLELSRRLEPLPPEQSRRPPRRL